MTFHVPEKFRVRYGPLRSTAADGNNGAFRVTSLKFKRLLNVIASDEAGWEHVSVSHPLRCPSWKEMSVIKALFWDAEDLVIQFHPPESEYINNHPYCLHLWRKAGTNNFVEIPPNILVGIKTGEVRP